MNFMRLVFLTLALSAAPTLASATNHETSGPLTAGEVRKVDAEAGKITIKHGPIVNLGMPAMTMVFQLKDASLLGQFKAGDQVQFAAEKISGQYIVTRIELAR